MQQVEKGLVLGNDKRQATKLKKGGGAKEFNRHFTREGIQIANILNIIREINITATVRCHYTHSTTARVRKR